MRWLRKERDLIGLIIIWGLLLQSLVVPLSTTAHAAMLGAGADPDGIICTTRSVNPVPAGTLARDEQKQSQKSADCQCCHMNCRQACGGTCGGVLGTFAYVASPRSTALSTVQEFTGHAVFDAAPLAESQPRAPPLA